MGKRPAPAASAAEPANIMVITLLAPWDVHREGALLRSDADLRALLDDKGVAWRESTEAERSIAGR